MLVKRLLGNSILAGLTLAVGPISHESNELNINQPVIKRNLDSEKILAGNPQFLCADKYRKLIKFEFDKKDETLNGKICRAYLPKEPNGKPLFILVLGHAEELDFSSDYSGIMHFYEKLKQEEKGIVLLFRTGLVTDEIGSMLSPKHKPEYEPKIVFKQTKEIIQDFITRYKPKELRLGGFSWGSGTIAQLAPDNDWRQSIPVIRTVMIDPISFGSLGFGLPLRTRPEFKDSLQHKNFHVYQRRDDLSITESIVRLQGNYPIKLIKDQEDKLKVIKDERTGDVIWHVPNTHHLEIANLTEVRHKAYDFLTSR